MHRLLTVGIVLLWVSAMTALFVRDVWPAWTAQDAPPMTRDELARFGGDQQLGIFDSAGKRLGTAWSSVSKVGSNTAIHGTVHIEGLSVVPVVLVETSTEFDEKGELDSFNLDVFGVPMTSIKVRGERHGIYFPCEIQMGPLFRQANLDMAASRLIGDSLRPFNYLPLLKVGQSWRMQIVDPLSAVMGGSTRFTSIVARVTGRETIDHDGKPVDCFRVETTPGQAKAWVAPDGRVLVQEVDVPMLGKVKVRDEDYDEQLRNSVRRRYRRMHGEQENQIDAGRPIEQLEKTLVNALGGGSR
ncbi:MAG TPA: hypothetical protein PLQ89_14315 [Phycisphaerae bacterium]|nr:hypothetical protein [Phycisphaerae bacterium]HOQ86883.1 hypothetical protein [Phycisphaerae bacterium]HPP27973.1 hypothetical protein [Phycisphaerae bacterium]